MAKDQTRLQVVFAGSDSFAFTCLQTLERSSQFEIVGVLLPANKPYGRGQIYQQSWITKRVKEDFPHLECHCPSRLNHDLELLKRLQTQKFGVYGWHQDMPRTREGLRIPQRHMWNLISRCARKWCRIDGERQ